MNLAHRSAALAPLLDALLRAVLRPRAAEVSARTLAQAVAIGGAIQGAAMGAYAFLNGGSAAFMLISALKIPLFLAVAGAMVLPALYVMYALWGLAGEFKPALRALAGGQAAFALILASLSPFTLVFYLSGATYRGALSFNVALFALSALAAQKLIRGRLQTLMQSDARHAQLLLAGFALWVFVAVQLAWNLRPFVGNPHAPIQFLRPDAFTNAYLALWRILVG